MRAWRNSATGSGLPQGTVAEVRVDNHRHTERLREFKRFSVVKVSANLREVRAMHGASMDVDNAISLVEDFDSNLATFPKRDFCFGASTTGQARCHCDHQDKADKS